MNIPRNAQHFSSRYAALNRPARVEPDLDNLDGFRPRMRFSGGDERYTLALAQRLQGEVSVREQALRALDNTAQDTNPRLGEVKTETCELNARGFSCVEGQFGWSREGSTFSGFSPGQAAVARFSEVGVHLDQYRW